MSPVFVCCRYLESNVRYLSTVRAYDARVPTYLHNRPQHFVQHCMRRLPPVADEFLASDVTETDIGTYVVRSGPSQYTVRMTVPVPSCECVDWDRHYLPCKHMLAIARHHGWEQLPLQYRQFPFFVIDEEVIGCRVPQVEELTISEVGTQSPTSDDSTDVEVTESETTATAALGTTSPRGDDVMDTEVTAATAGESTSGDKATAKLQSQLRQKLARLTSLSYDIDDDSLLTSIIAAVQEQVQLCTTAVRGVGIPQRNRRRIAKRNAADAFLRRRLKAAKRSRRARKVAVKQRKVKGNMSSDGC